MTNPNDELTSEIPRKPPCCSRENLILVASFVLVLFNFLDDSASSASAAAYSIDYNSDEDAVSNQTGTSKQNTGILIGSTLLGLFANLSGFVCDLGLLKAIKKGLPETATPLSYSIHFLLALASLSVYGYTAYGGSVEDLRPEPFSNTTVFQPLAKQISNNITDYLAIIPAIGWSSSEGWAGCVFFAGTLLGQMLTQQLAVLLCQKSAAQSSSADNNGTIDPSFSQTATVSLLSEEAAPEQQLDLTTEPSSSLGAEDQVTDVLKKIEFLVKAVGLAGLALQTWLSLFDVFAVTAASSCEKPEQALVAMRVLTGFLAVCLSLYFTDYYLRSAREQWIPPFVAQVFFRVCAGLGMGCFFFATSFNRIRLFLPEDVAPLYALMMGVANMARYGVYCYRQANPSEEDGRGLRKTSYSHRDLSVTTLTREGRAHSLPAKPSEHLFFASSKRPPSRSAVLPLVRKPSGGEAVQASGLTDSDTTELRAGSAV